MRQLALLPVIMCAALGMPAHGEGLGAPGNLRCEYEHNPIGLDAAQPRLSWEVNDTRRGAKQAAYQIVVAPDEVLAAAGNGATWDSGRVDSAQSIHVSYGGPALAARQRCYWSVRTWDADGAVSPFAAPAYWEMGLLDAADWQAKWIMIDEQKAEPGPFFGDWIWHPGEEDGEVRRYFRKIIELPKGAQVVAAKAWGAANNEYTFFLNGKEIGGCDEWKAVESFDVADVLVPGQNIIAIVGVHARDIGGITFGMRITLAGGNTIEVRSAEDWLTSTEGPDGWTGLDFDTTDWIRPRRVAAAGAPPWGDIAGRFPGQSCYLRREFSAEHKNVVCARAYVSALGAYRLYVNGRRVGQDELTPGWTYFPKHILYQTYDVTPLLHDSANAVGILLGNGWWGGSMAGAWKDGNLRGIVQIEIDYDDGTRQIIASDEHWKGRVSPIVKDSIYHGETYDAQREIPGWNEPGCDEAGWLPARLWEQPSGLLTAQVGPTIQVSDELAAVAVTEPKPGVFVFDFGQNAAGRTRLKVKGPAGTRVQIRHGEILQPDGNLFTENLQGAKCTDAYILKGGEEETWEPAFTYSGFRYAEVTGYPGTPGADALVMRVMHAAVPAIGTFVCSEDIINRVQQNIIWGAWSNFYSVPTDCPQRDERLGWTGDMQLFLQTACWNMHVAGYMTKWMRDIVDSRNADGSTTDVAPARSAGPAAPGWGDAVVIVPWGLYTYYGDTRIIETNYAAMSDWVAYMRNAATDGLYVAERYGDWVPVEPSPKKTIAGAYQYLSTKRLAEMARAIGKADEATALEREAVAIASRYNERYFDAAVNQYEGATQTANIVPLWFGITPEDEQAAVIDNIARNIAAHDNHLTTGFIGTAYLMPVLSTFGQDTLAGRLAVERAYPSWGYMVEKGATTIWERWDSDRSEKYGSGMNSFNHYAFGTVGQWYYEYLAGIRPIEPGFKRILIEPHTSAAQWVNASFASMYGPIRCAWRKDNGFTLDIEIPANTTALVRTPVPCNAALGPQDRKITDTAGNTAFEIGAGIYTFTMANR